MSQEGAFQIPPSTQEPVAATIKQTPAAKVLGEAEVSALNSIMGGTTPASELDQRPRKMSPLERAAASIRPDEQPDVRERSVQQIKTDVIAAIESGIEDLAKSVDGDDLLLVLRKFYRVLAADTIQQDEIEVDTPRFDLDRTRRVDKKSTIDSALESLGSGRDLSDVIEDLLGD